MTPVPEYFDGLNGIAHGFYVASLLFYFVRFTSVFSLNPYLGPKLSMIRKMMAELLLFFVLIYGKCIVHICFFVSSGLSWVYV